MSWGLAPIKNLIQYSELHPTKQEVVSITDEAKGDPTSDIADGKFEMLAAEKGRTEKAQQAQSTPSAQHSKFAQVLSWNCHILCFETEIYQI